MIIHQHSLKLIILHQMKMLYQQNKNVLVLFYLLLIKHMLLNLKKQKIDYLQLKHHLQYILNQILQLNFIFLQQFFKMNNQNQLEMSFHHLIKTKQVKKINQQTIVLFVYQNFLFLRFNETKNNYSSNWSKFFT